FSEDDTHVALIVASGGLEAKDQGSVVKKAVDTTQIAVTALDSLGLDPNKLQGAVADGTKELPGLHLDQIVKDKQAANQVLNNITPSIFIYQENWTSDSLYGLSPGANGLANVFSTPQFLYPQSNTGVGILGESLNPIPKPINNNVSPAVPDSRFPD